MQLMIEPPEKTYQRLLFGNKNAIQTTFSLSKLKTILSNLKNKSDQYVIDFIRSLSDSSLSSLDNVLGILGNLVPDTLWLIVYAEKDKRAQLRATIEKENKTISNWVAIKKQLLGRDSSNLSRDELLREAKLYFECLALIMSIRPVKEISIKNLYDAIPRSVISVISRLIKWNDFSYGTLVAVAIPGAMPDTDSVLRWYIKKASKSLMGYDLAVCIIVQVIKRLLDISFLPIPSITTLYLVGLWSAMLADLSLASCEVWVVDDLIGLGIAFIAMLQQTLNREGPIMSFIKKLYAIPIMAEDLVDRIPPDMRAILEGFLNIKFDTRTYVESLTNIASNWNYALGELTDVDNLSIGKALDMLYTYRIGITYLDYVKTNQGLSVGSFAEYWGNYGPLPKSRQQIEEMLDLFRGDNDKYNEKINDIYTRHISRLSASSPYSIIIEECGGIYDEISRLNISYYPSTYELTNTFQIKRKHDHPLIFMIAGRIKESFDSNPEITWRDQEHIASDIFTAIDNYIKHHA